MALFLAQVTLVIAMAIAIVPHTKKVSEPEITAFESTIAAKLPDDYRSFLLTSNGGRLDFTKSRNIVFPVRWNGQHWAEQLDGALLEELYSLDENAPNSLQTSYKYMRVTRKLIPVDTIPIGDVSGGALLLAIQGEYRGRVLYWSQDFMSIEDDFVPDYTNIGIVAESFPEFLELLMPL